jgi:hypothetical protein
LPSGCGARWRRSPLAGGEGNRDAEFLDEAVELERTRLRPARPERG